MNSLETTVSCCGLCRHFVKDGQKPSGSCYRYPPVAYPMGNGPAGLQVMSVYPGVEMNTKACGEFVDVEEPTC